MEREQGTETTLTLTAASVSGMITPLWDLTPQQTIGALHHYIDEIHHQATTAGAAISTLRPYLAGTKAVTAVPDITRAMNSAQTVLNAGAAISRYLFPAPGNKDDAMRPRRIERGARLRAELRVSDDSPLKARVLRNAIEHSDERFDALLPDALARGDSWVFDSVMGSADAAPVVNAPAQLQHVRSLDLSTSTLRVFEASLPLIPYADAIKWLQVSCRGWQNDHPLPKAP